MSGIIANVLGPDGLIVVVVLAIVLLFGGAKLPKLARGLGSASHEFRKGMEEGGTSEDASVERDRSHVGERVGVTERR